MKMLSLNIYYKLPDNFDGDMNDAIEHMLKYRRSEKNHTDNFKHDPVQDIYANWWDMIHQTDRPLFGEVQYAKLDKKQNKWIDI